MPAEIPREQREAFLSERPLLHAFLDPRRLPVSTYEDRMRAEEHLIFEVQRVERHLNPEWLGPAAVTASALIAGTLHHEFDGHHILQSHNSPSLFNLAKTFFLIGWQGGIAAAQFAPDIVVQLENMGHLDMSVDYPFLQKSKLSSLAAGAIMAGVTAKTEHMPQGGDLSADVERFMRQAERRLHPDDSSEDQAS